MKDKLLKLADYLEEISEDDDGIDIELLNGASLIRQYNAPRELSDEEIMQVSHEALEQSGLTKDTNFMVVFAKEILKKASEK